MATVEQAKEWQFLSSITTFLHSLFHRALCLFSLRLQMFQTIFSNFILNCVLFDNSLNIYLKPFVSQLQHYTTSSKRRAGKTLLCGSLKVDCVLIDQTWRPKYHPGPIWHNWHLNEYFPLSVGVAYIYIQGVFFNWYPPYKF